MDSYEFKMLLVAFNDDLEEIGEDLCLAYDGDLEGEDKENAIKAAQSKINEYESTMGSLEEPFRTKFEEKFSEDIEFNRGRLNEMISAGRA